MIKDFLFDITAKLGFFLISANQKIGQVFAYIIGVLSGASTYVIAKTFALLLKLIDSKRYLHASQASEQADISSELDILQQISSVKENALEMSTWTPEHTIMIQTLGSRLYSECQWSENNVHQYLRDVVESIPGLSYATSDGMSDEEDDEDEGYFKIDS